MQQYENLPLRWHWCAMGLQLVVKKINPYYSLYHHRCWNHEVVPWVDTSSGLSCWYQKNGHTYGKKYRLGLFHHINVFNLLAYSRSHFSIWTSSSNTQYFYENQMGGNIIFLFYFLCHTFLYRFFFNMCLEFQNSSYKNTINTFCAMWP